MKLILSLLDKPIAFQRVFVEITGCVTGALMLSQAVYWQQRTTLADGWWWKTQTDWEKETGMSRRELDTARKATSKFLFCERRGLPAKCFYKIDIDALFLALGVCKSSLAETAKQVCTEEPNSDGGNRQSTNTENTTENTTESTVVATPLKIESEYTKFIRLWTEGHLKRFGRPYRFNGGRDGKAVKTLLTGGLIGGENAETLMAVVNAAWAAIPTKEREMYWCQRLVEIHVLDERWNFIQSELKPAVAQRKSKYQFIETPRPNDSNMQ